MNDKTLKLRHAIEADDHAEVERITRENPQLLNGGGCPPPLARARSVAMAERLLEMGADVRALSEWWGNGIGAKQVDVAVAKFLVGRGAELTIHATVAFGLTDRLKKFLEADRSLVHAKGGDGCTPLHFARDVPTAKILVAHGARLDARDDDHDSTPAQWLIGESPEVSRWLLERGAKTDIFLALALGDRPLAERLIAADRACLSHWIGGGPEFPAIGHKGRGGTIYQWTLGFNSFPHQIALEKGHRDLFDFAYSQSDTTTQFLVCCVLARRELAEQILSRNPRLVASLSEMDQQLMARYCWETNLNYEAVRLMLDMGFPLTRPETAHGYTPLHNASWAGADDLVELLLKRGHPTNIVDPTYKSMPLAWAIHDCVVEKRHPEGNFARVVQLLVDAGSPLDGIRYPTGNPEIDNILQSKIAAKPKDVTQS